MNNDHKMLTENKNEKQILFGNFQSLFVNLQPEKSIK
jgi:hypothetical protein